MSVTLFIMLYKMALTFQSVDEILHYVSYIQMKGTGRYFPVELFISCAVQGGSNV